MVEDKKVLDSDSLIAVREFVEGQVKPINKEVKELSQNLNSAINGINEKIVETNAELRNYTDEEINKIPISSIVDYTIRIKEMFLEEHKIINPSTHPHKISTEPILIVHSYPISNAVLDLIPTGRVVLRLPWLNWHKKRKKGQNNKFYRVFNLPDNWDFLNGQQWVKEHWSDEERATNKEILKNLFIKYHWVVITPKMIKTDRNGNKIISLSINLFERTLSQIEEYNPGVTQHLYLKSNCNDKHISVHGKSFITLLSKYVGGDGFGPNALYHKSLNSAYAGQHALASTFYKSKKVFSYSRSSQTPLFYIADSIWNKDYDYSTIPGAELRLIKRRIVHNFRPEVFHFWWNDSNSTHYLFTPESLMNIKYNIYNRSGGRKGNCNPWHSEWSILATYMKTYERPNFNPYYRRGWFFKHSSTKGVVRELINPNFAILAEDWNNNNCKHIWYKNSPMIDKYITIEMDEMFSFDAASTQLHNTYNIDTSFSYSIQDYII